MGRKKKKNETEGGGRTALRDKGTGESRERERWGERWKKKQVG